MIPAKWSKLSQYFYTGVDTKELTKFITEKKPREIAGTLYIGSGAPLANIIDRIAVDLTSEDVAVEIKELQVWNSERALALLFCPDIPLRYIAAQLRSYILPQALFDLSLEQTSPVRRSLLQQENTPINVHLSYPQNYFTSSRKGERPRYDMRNKQMPIVETDATQRRLLTDALPFIKKYCRERLGIKVLPNFIKPAEDDGNSDESPIAVQRYRNNCDAHLAMKESTSYTALPGILRLDDPMTLTKPDTAGTTMKTSVRDLLMDATLLDNKPLLSAAYMAGADVEVAYPHTRHRRAKVEMIAQCPAAYCMYQLLSVYKLESTECVRFLNANFLQTHVNVAMAHTTYDADTDFVLISDDLGALDGDGEDAERRQIVQDLEIDMSILETDASTRTGVRESGQLFNHDDSNSILSANTQDYARRLTGGDIHNILNPPETQHAVRASGSSTHPGSGARTPPTPSEGAGDAGEGGGSPERAAHPPGKE